jgi:hypothetical protein
MTQSAHFINRKQGQGREGLTRIAAAHYTSCCWVISEEEATKLLGGWIYFHETKADRSAMGGVVTAVQRADRIGESQPDRYVISFDSRIEGKGQKWRGADHNMAWWSGIVETMDSHEHGNDEG